jgi:ParB/RepB/Spo0J family partition protein
MNTQVSSQSSVTSVALAIRNLALKSIEPSATAVQERRRTHYDAAALKDLAENIKAVQVIEPIIVRPKRDGEHTETFEIVAGERRWRASREAGLDTIPAIVRALDDSQVLEIQLVENLHREGLIGYVGNLSSISCDFYWSSLRESRYFSSALCTVNA